MDVAVKRGAVCNTDQHLVCAKLRLRGIRYGRRRGSRAKDKRFEVEAISKDGESAVRDEYLEKVLEKAREAWCEDNGVDEKWLTIQSALVTTAEDVLGRAGRSQPDWFRDTVQELKPLLNLRKAAYSRWLGTGKQEDLIRFKEARSKARRSVWKVKKCMVPGEGRGD